MFDFINGPKCSWKLFGTDFRFMGAFKAASKTRSSILPSWNPRVEFNCASPKSNPSTMATASGRSLASTVSRRACRLFRSSSVKWTTLSISLILFNATFTRYNSSRFSSTRFKVGERALDFGPVTSARKLCSTKARACNYRIYTNIYWKYTDCVIQYLSCLGELNACVARGHSLRFSIINPIW